MTWRNRHGEDYCAEDGFTLVELLIVLVILPLVIGAAAVGVIAAQRNQSQLHGRIVDSANAELASANFVRDVQGATWITESSAATTPTPVCGSGTELLVALARQSSFSVAYWWTAGSPATVIRYACTWGSSSPSSTVTISDDAVSVQAQQPLASILPATPYGTSAATTWIQVAPLTTVSTSVSLPASSITVGSTSGFNFGASSSVQIQGCTGSTILSVSCVGPVNETITCTTIASLTQLSGCTGGSGVALQGGYVSQASSVTAVNLSIYQPTTTYALALRAVPRPVNSLTNGNGVVVSPGNPNSSPALLTLGSGVVLQGGAGVSVSVSGVIDTSSGTFDCGSVRVVTATGYENISGSGSVSGTCLGSVPLLPLATATTDPLSGGLPRPMSLPAADKSCYGVGLATYVVGSCSVMPSGTCPPGEYLQALTDGCNLQPGVYILDNGYSSTHQALSMAAGSPSGQGVLLYLPCISGACAETINMGGSASIALPPISATQAESYFGSTDLAGVVIWQDVGDTAGDSIGGTPSTVTAGTIYLPGASVTLFGNAGSDYGQIIAQAVTVQGSGTLTITPPTSTQ